MLARIRDAIDDLFAKRSGERAWEKGVTEAEVRHLVSMAAGLPDPFAGFKINPIRQGDTGCFNLPEDTDELASRCLEGAATSDGGRVGIPLQTTGWALVFDRPCFRGAERTVFHRGCCACPPYSSHADGAAEEPRVPEP
ncbi:unnamed protein product [Ectocarpus sp. 6 AP-2014]